jgi:hypothetical protein
MRGCAPLALAALVILAWWLRRRPPTWEPFAEPWGEM